MRCFVAIDIDKKTQAAIAELQNDLQSKIKLRNVSIKWVRPEQMHLTLKFLGETEEGKIDTICAAAEKAVADCEKFDINISTLGCFGKPVKVVWAGMENENELLNKLQTGVEDEMEKAGWAKEKRGFNAHLTLGRVKGDPGKVIKDVIYKYGPIAIPAIKTEAICVYKSDLTPQAAIYTNLKRMELK